MKTKTKVVLTLGLLSLLALGGLTQSKYVRHSTIEMDITSEKDPGVSENYNTEQGNLAVTVNGYSVPKTGYYAIQLRGGDGGTNISGAGGKGCVVEGVYHLTAGQTISYTLGGRGGHTQNGTDNKGKGQSGYQAGGTGGTATAASREGSGCGGASAVRLDGTVLLVAGGGGGGAGGNSASPAAGGTGASNLSGQTGIITKNSGQNGRNGTSINGENHSVLLVRYNGGGGAGGGYNTASYGGIKGGNDSSFAGSGDGGASYVNSTNYQPLTPALKATYAAKIPATGANNLDQISATTGGGNISSGQIRIAFLWTDAEASHKEILNIYK